MAQRVQLRRDTAANWTAVDPILGEGEFGYEKNTGLAKIGDGAAHWTALPYFVTGGGGGGGTAASTTFAATGSIAATNVQTAIVEVATDAAADLAAHSADTTAVHGITDTTLLYRQGGVDVAIVDGGTGASSAANARTNLGLGTAAIANTTAFEASGAIAAALANFRFENLKGAYLADTQPAGWVNGDIWVGP